LSGFFASEVARLAKLVSDVGISKE